MSFWGDFLRPKCDYVLCFIFAPNKRLLADQRIGPHRYDILCIIIGSLLGDAYAEKRINATRIHFQQESSNKEHLLNTWRILNEAGYCTDIKPTIQKRKGNDGKVRYVCRFKTYSFSSLNWIHEAFYPNGKKIVPLNIIDYLSPIGLATWIMDDGTWAGSGVRIATNSFTYDEVLHLCSVLDQKYNIKATVNIGGYDKHDRNHIQYNVYIHAESIAKLRSIVMPHFVPSMVYKLGI